MKTAALKTGIITFLIVFIVVMSGMLALSSGFNHPHAILNTSAIQRFVSHEEAYTGPGFSSTTTNRSPQGVPHRGGTPNVSGINPGPIIEELLSGSDDTVRVLYMGNSRVSRSIGYAYDGIEEIAFEQGRLAGNGFVVPLKGIGQNPEDVRFLLNEGYGMTNNQAWAATDMMSVLHAHAFNGVFLKDSRSMKMSNFGSDELLLRKDVPLTLTVQYFAGPSKGAFSVTPIEVLGTTTIVHSHPSTLVNSSYVSNVVRFTDITLPPMINTSLERSILISNVYGESVVYRLNVVREVENGIAISEMAIGGKSYIDQSLESETPSVSWKAYVDAYDPDLVLWQFAGNHDAPVEELVSATKLLMDRVSSVAPNAAHVVIIDNPTPRLDTWEIVNDSKIWAAQLEGYRGAIVLDPTEYLPQDFLDLAGTAQLGQYFDNPVHENRLGSRVVADALWDAFEYTVQ